jgi:hypothetical protein
LRHVPPEQPAHQRQIDRLQKRQVYELLQVFSHSGALAA